MAAPTITDVQVLGNQVTITGTNLWQDMVNVQKRNLESIGSDTNVNGVTFVSSLFGTGANFIESSAQRIETSDNTTFSGSYSVGAWGKVVATTGGGQVIVTRGDPLAANGDDFQATIRNDLDFQLNMRPPGGAPLDRKIIRTTGGQIPLNENCHIGFTWDNGVSTNIPKIFINGVEETVNISVLDNDSFTSLKTGSDTFIGGNMFDGGYFNGVLDNIYLNDAVWSSNDFKNQVPVVVVNAINQPVANWIQFSAAATSLVLDFGSAPPNSFPVTVENADGVSNTFIFTDTPTINLPDCSEVLWPIQPQNVTNRFVNRSDNMIWQGGNRTSTPNTSKTNKISFRIDSRFAATFENEIEAARQVAAILNIDGYDFFNDGFSKPLVYVLSVGSPVREQAFYRYDIIFKKVP